MQHIVLGPSWALLLTHQKIMEAPVFCREFYCQTATKGARRLAPVCLPDFRQSSEFIQEAYAYLAGAGEMNGVGGDVSPAPDGMWTC